MGFMNAPYKVQNQGIFLTDSKQMAHYFGSNRSEDGRNYKIYETYANLDACLDAMAMPLPLRKLGLGLTNKYYGSQKRQLALSDIWWLLDRPEFISQVKELGYSSIKFKEDTHVQKVASGTSYLILDPSKIAVKCKANDKIKDLKDIVPFMPPSACQGEDKSQPCIMEMNEAL